MIRAFIAIPLPRDVQDRLAQFQRDLQRLAPGATVRWTPPEQIHLTLRFLGDIGEEVIPPLTDGLRLACRGLMPFDLRAEGAGCFPNRHKPRVLWAGIAGDVAPLRRLQQRIEEHTGAWGQREERGFRGHLTLGRVKEGRSRETAPLGDALDASAGVSFGSWRVNAVVLMRSELSSQGARHSTLASVELAVPPSD